MPKVIAHRKGAKDAKRKFLYKKPLRALRLCGEPYKNDRIPLPTGSQLGSTFIYADVNVFS